jgi:hypothetical protein
MRRRLPSSSVASSCWAGDDVAQEAPRTAPGNEGGFFNTVPLSLAELRLLARRDVGEAVNLRVANGLLERRANKSDQAVEMAAFIIRY